MKNKTFRNKFLTRKLKKGNKKTRKHVKIGKKGGFIPSMETLNKHYQTAQAVYNDPKFHESLAEVKKHAADTAVHGAALGAIVTAGTTATAATAVGTAGTGAPATVTATVVTAAPTALSLLNSTHQLAKHALHLLTFQTPIL